MPCQTHSAVTTATATADAHAHTHSAERPRTASAATYTIGTTIGDMTLGEMSLNVSARATIGSTKLVAA